MIHFVHSQLLTTLEQLCGDLPILTINDDLLNFQNYLDKPPVAVFCMGDTLTHLSSTAAVHSLFELVVAALLKGGIFVTTFRDYSTPLNGDQRFIPVRSDASRILTCFLEYQSETVLVHDILHERRENQWHTRISHYPKLKLTPAMVCKWLESYGFAVECSPGLRGMQRLVAKY